MTRELLQYVMNEGIIELDSLLDKSVKNYFLKTNQDN